MKKHLICSALGLSLLGLALTVSAADSAAPTLKDTFKDSFMVGTAVNRLQAMASATERADNANRTPEQLDKDITLIKTQFNQISPENDLKWALIQPREGPDGYDFGPADAYVNFGMSNHMYIVGHVLVWHSQTPNWVFTTTNAVVTNVEVTSAPAPVTAAATNTNAAPRGRGFGRGRGPTGPPAPRELVLQRMHDHIFTVMGRYKGKIKVWDVVNEALVDNENASDTNLLHSSPWLNTIGPDFIAKAFEYAHEADPDAILRYNDFSTENPVKRKRLITLIKMLQAQKVPVMAIGMQTHGTLIWPGAQLEDEALTEVASLGLPIHITELDLNGAAGGQRNTGADIAANGAATQGGMVDAAQQKLADEYTVLFDAFLKHRDSVKVVTFWGANDGVSWRRNGNPLLFDGNDMPKPAFDAVIKTHATMAK